MEGLTAGRIVDVWESLRFPADVYGSDPGVRERIYAPAAEAPKIRSAIDWLHEHLEEFRAFLSDHDYRWAFEPGAYGAGIEAYLQMRVLQQLSALHRIYEGAGMRPPPMGDVVARVSLTSRYDMMSPRYRPHEGIHFVVVPIGFADWSLLLWWAVYCWCTGGDAIDVDPWLAVTARRRSLGETASKAEPSPALLELIARHFADPAKDRDVDRTDAAAAIAAELPSFRRAAGLRPPAGLTAFDEDIGYVLFDWSLSHELGHRLAGHAEHAQPGDPGYLDAEQEADRLGFDLFRASWGWRSGLLERVPLDEAGRIFLGPLVFFHTARLQSILRTAVNTRLGTEAPGASDIGESEQEYRARRWLEAAAAWIQSLEGTSAAMSTETRARIEAFAVNMAGFGDHVAAVVGRIPDAEIRRIPSIVGRLAK